MDMERRKRNALISGCACLVVGIICLAVRAARMNDYSYYEYSYSYTGLLVSGVICLVMAGFNFLYVLVIHCRKPPVIPQATCVIIAPQQGPPVNSPQFQQFGPPGVSQYQYNYPNPPPSYQQGPQPSQLPAGSFPPQSGVSSPQDGAFPPQAGAFPPQTGAFPPQTGAFPPQTGAFPPQTGAFQPQAGAFPSQAGAFPPQAGAPWQENKVQTQGGILSPPNEPPPPYADPKYH